MKTALTLLAAFAFACFVLSSGHWTLLAIDKMLAALDRHHVDATK